MRRLGCLATVVGLCVACGGTAVAAGGQLPYGKLTSSEYSSLGRMLLSVKAAAHMKPANWSAMRAACLDGKTSTAILVTARSSCEADISFLQALAAFPSAAAKCGQAEPQKLQCDASLYNKLARSDRASYISDTAARAAAMKRGIYGICLEVIATSAHQLAVERQLAAATDTLATDVKDLLDAEQGHPVPGITPTKIDRDSRSFETDFNAVVASSGPSNIRVCPHT
jgi:hypothetical protein